MFRTIIGLIRFWAYQIRTIPDLRRAQKLDREGKFAERDEKVNVGVPVWARHSVSLTGATVEVRGQENLPAEGSVVFVSNHQGNFDIPILLGYVNKPKAFISKIEILKVPLVSGWMKLMQCSFMDRKNMRQSVKTIAEAVETIKKGYSMVIFPEGTRSKSDTIGEFKAGSLKLAFKSGAPIVPVTINGSWHLMEETGFMKPAHVVVTIHPAIPVAGLSREETETLSDKIRTIIESGMKN